MGYANHIGRVGALAVTLGVGWAVASAPGVAFADTTESSSTSQSPAGGTSAPSPDASSAKDTDDAGDEQEPTKEPGDTDATDGVENEDDSNPRSYRPNSAGEQDIAEEPGEPEEAPTDIVDAAVPEVEELEKAEPDPAESATAQAATPAATAPPPEPTASEPALATLLTDLTDGLPAPQPDPAPVAPLPGATLLASLAAVRDELERNAVRRTAAVMPAAAYIDDGTPNVLVIGVDGTNLSRVLANPDLTTNFFTLMQGGTTAASTIVGHTTISNPSWSSILTGAWGEKTGVINNVFTPWTYDKWPTVFTQLEGQDSSIRTTSIANWDVISAIAASGIGADSFLNVAQVAGDTNWLLTDDRVGDLTEDAIAAADADTANFMFSYFVGVDENGHMYGGDSPEYLAALANFDRNLGEIMDAVALWEAATGEKWTIIMVTDHGHQPQLGFGHGFQSPDETTTFVVARSPGLFGEGLVNTKYSIVDVTPTVLSLFDLQPTVDDLDGVSLTELGDADLTPVNNDEALRETLLDIIAKYGYPDIGTNLALGARTIFASIPYFVDMITTGLTTSLQSIVDQDIFLISAVAALAIIPVRIIGGLTYVGTNIVAQIVARLTGVTGASIFPLWPPAPPSFPDAPDISTPDLVALMCSDGRITGAVFACGDSVAV
ncbi:alkaline phosphatase family protein [Mycobacterium sp. NAZ190054]|uniref:alkaline phosphatase family protein n=1 Tax=Mycobacterium sp. NAZ190054 TaxID=1747766 RepID=UPI0007935066|nr:alkaline phosphatase family protein [Mycobacterium sp. NAZ190054]KWX64153.1 phosphodiesterase [Mycobacterium sp. NAZ190054]